MSEQDKIQLFENQPIRTAWDEEKEEWYFSVVDVVGALTDQTTSRGASTYWAVVKKRLKDEGADQLLTNCKQLKMTAADGKKAQNRCCYHRTAFAHHPIYSFPQGRAYEGVAGPGRPRAY